MFLAADLPSDRGIGDGPCGDNMQTLPFDVLDAPDPFPETINLVDDDEEGAPKGCDGQVQPTSVGKSLPPQHGGCAPQLEQAPSGKSLPLQHHGGCAQPEIPLQNNGQPEAPLPPQHGGGDGQPGQASSGKLLPEQSQQAVRKPLRPQHGGCDGHGKPLSPQHGGFDRQNAGAPLPQHEQAPADKSLGERARPEIVRQHGGCAQQPEQASSGKPLPLQHHGGCAQPEVPRQHGGCAQPEVPLPPQHGGGDGQPGQTPPGKSLPEQPKQASTEVRAAPSGHSYSLPEVCSNMGISSQAQPDFARSKGKVETYDVETLEDAEVQGLFQFFEFIFL